jgi:hypothetical protein
MSLPAAADHLSFENVERGEECRGAVALVDHGSWFRRGPSSWEDPVGCGLDLGLLNRQIERWRGPVD